MPDEGASLILEVPLLEHTALHVGTGDLAAYHLSPACMLHKSCFTTQIMISDNGCTMAWLGTRQPGTHSLNWQW